MSDHCRAGALLSPDLLTHFACPALRRGSHAARIHGQITACRYFGRALPGRIINGVFSSTWSTFSPHRNKRKPTASLRTLAAISVAHWVSHFHLFVLPMLFPFLKEQLGVGYIELGFALTVFGLVSGLTQAPIGYLADHIGARKVLLIGLASAASR